MINKLTHSSLFVESNVVPAKPGLACGPQSHTGKLQYSNGISYAYSAVQSQMAVSQILPFGFALQQCCLPSVLVQVTIHRRLLIGRDGPEVCQPRDV